MAHFFTFCSHLKLAGRGKSNILLAWWEKLTVTKEILDWNVCQVTETESTVVFLQSCDSIGEQKEISVLRVFMWNLAWTKELKNAFAQHIAVNSSQSYPCHANMPALLKQTTTPCRLFMRSGPDSSTLFRVKHQCLADESNTTVICIGLLW